jgi:hypothetical protein
LERESDFEGGHSPEERLPKRLKLWGSQAPSKFSETANREEALGNYWSNKEQIPSHLQVKYLPSLFNHSNHELS